MSHPTSATPPRRTGTSARTGGAPARDQPPGGSALAERTLALLQQAHQVGPAQRATIEEEVVTSHLWLADSLARRYDHRGEEIDDLQQVARAGLVEAVRRFDPERGAFIPFAVPTIIGVLKRHFRDHGWMVRPPRRTQELAAQIRRQWPDLAQQLQSDPTRREMAASLDQPVEAVREADRASQSYAFNSLDAALAAGVSFPTHEGHRMLDECEARLVIDRVWRHLDDAERRLLTLRFYEERSQSDIAARIRTSQMQVSRLLTRTLRRVRALVGTDGASPGS